MGLKYSKKSEIIFIEIQNRENGNSFGVSEAKELRTILDDSMDSSTQGLVFYNSDLRFFCTGGNLKDYAKHIEKEDGILVNRKISAQLSYLANLEIPTVAVVTGDCFGGGLELLSCFDYVLSAPHCYFGLWQRRVGLVFGWGGWGRWVKKISEKTLQQLCLEGRSFGAYEAHQMGFVDRVGGSSGLMSLAIRWIERQKLLPRGPIRTIKRLGERPENELFEELWWSAEHREILDIFRNR